MQISEKERITLNAINWPNFAICIAAGKDTLICDRHHRKVTIKYIQRSVNCISRPFDGWSQSFAVELVSATIIFIRSDP